MRKTEVRAKKPQLYLRQQKVLRKPEAEATQAFRIPLLAKLLLN